MLIYDTALYMRTSMITPTQKLKALDYPLLEDEVVFVSKDELEEFKAYIKELISMPDIAYPKAQKILVLYIEAIQYIIKSFDTAPKLDEDLVSYCDKLSKTLYMLYRDANVMLYCRKIEYLWKAYIKICKLSERVPDKSIVRAVSNRDRISKDLWQLSKQIRTFY